jgi:peptide chain release factor 3
MKRKQFLKGIAQLSQEGAIQLYYRDETGLEETLCGVVGTLQFDVLSYRLKSEYGVDLLLDNMPWRFIRWIEESPKDVNDLQLTSTTARGRDAQGNDVLLFENEWSIRLAQEKNPGLVLLELAPMSEEWNTM